MRMATFIFAMFLAGCEVGSVGSETPSTRPATTAPTSSPASRQSRRDLTLEDFKRLRPNMTLEEIYARLGKPEQNLGSGILILKYVLTDDSPVFVGSSGARILYIRHGSLHGGEELLKNGE